MLNQKEFHSTEELESVKAELATASKKPVYVGLDREYEEPGYGDRWEERRLGNDEEVLDLRNKSAIWNERDEEMAYFASNEYALVQHTDVLESVQEAVGKTVSDIDMGVIRDYGAQIDGTLVFSNVDDAMIDVAEVVDTDGYIPPEGDIDPRGNSIARDRLGLGIRIGNSFDGSKRVKVSTMGYRFICQNWMVWGEEEIASMDSVHVGQDDDEFKAELTASVENVIGEVFEIKDEVSDMIKVSESQEIPFGWVPGLLDQAGFGTNYQKQITGRVLRQENQRRGETSAWRLYNAATTYLDNDRADDMSKQVYDRYQGRSWNLLGEPSAPADPMSDDELEEWAMTDF